VSRTPRPADATLSRRLPLSAASPRRAPSGATRVRSRSGYHDPPALLFASRVCGRSPLKAASSERGFAAARPFGRDTGSISAGRTRRLSRRCAPLGAA